MGTEYFYHKNVSDARIKICKKTAIIEELRYVNPFSSPQSKTKKWKRVTAIPLPLKGDHADRIAKLYGLPDPLRQKLRGE